MGDSSQDATAHANGAEQATRVSDWVRAVAVQHGIDIERFLAGADGDQADEGDAEAEFDATERLLLALTRQGLVTQSQLSALHGAYLHQTG